MLALGAFCACSTASRPSPHAPTPDLVPPPGDPVARLSGGAPPFFLSDHLTGAEYTEIRPDGTYRTLSREHMFVGETDAGRWRQTGSGELLLCSAYQYRYVSAPPLWIVVGSVERYAGLAGMRDTIRTNLAQNAGPSFLTKSLEAMSIESDDFGNPETPREALASLAREIDAYLASGDENLFHTWPRTYAGHVYLDPAWTIPSGARDAEGVHGLHDDLDHGRPSLAVVAIDEATFAASTSSPQPFMFHKELNGCVGAAVEPRDLKGTRIDARCRDFR
jgi:hypothetical protein